MPPAPSPETILMTKTLGRRLAEEAVAGMDAAAETMEAEMAVEEDVLEVKTNHGQ